MRECVIQLENDVCISVDMNDKMIDDLHLSLKHGGGLFYAKDVIGFVYYINIDKIVYIHIEV